MDRHNGKARYFHFNQAILMVNPALKFRALLHDRGIAQARAAAPNLWARSRC